VRPRKYTPEQEAEAIALLQEMGPAEAARRTGIAKGTIASWAHRAGLASEAGRMQTAAATEARALTIAERKTALAEALMLDAERMRRDLFASTTERKAFGATRYTDSEVVTIHNPTTTASERKVTIEAIAKAVETVNLLTGEATQRIEQLGAGDGTPAPERAKAEETVLQLVRGTAA
jgi:transposase-like protein